MNENKDVKPSEQSEDIVANDATDKVEDKVNKTPTDVQVKSESQQQSKEINKYEAKAGISTLNLFDDKQLAAAEVFLSKVIKSGKSGITSVADGLAVLMRANDLGLPFSTCIEHIHVINGKTGVDIHIVKALLSRAGCTWSCLKDYQPLYEYTDGINVYIDGSFPEYGVRCKDEAEANALIEADKTGDKVYFYPVKFYKDLAGNIYRDYQINDKFGIGVNRLQLDNHTKAGRKAIYRIPAVPVDYVTEYELTRKLNGKEIKAKGRFSYTEAHTAELFTKDTYTKYARVLISHRAFTYAARELASDIIMGVSETTELKIVAGVPLDAKDVDGTEEATYVEI